MTIPGIGYWTNPSVALLAQGRDDPVAVIVDTAREIILDAVEKGWAGPPFDPFWLAEELRIQVAPRDDVLDARLVPGGPRGRIEFNPNRPPGRIRFSVAHELAHTLFPDYVAAIRHRGRAVGDAWQVELLCNIVAAEFLMPIGTGLELESESVDIDNLMRLRKRFDVSTEALFLRMVRLTSQACAVFAAARVTTEGETPVFRIDYAVPSRSWHLEMPRGFRVSGASPLAECTAIGYTAKKLQRWRPLPELMVECVGIPPYPGDSYPRVAGILRRRLDATSPVPQLSRVYGDATEPRGPGPHLIAHVVNDKTPNWGAGFAREVKKKWPSVQDDFKRWANEPGKLALGNSHLTTISSGASIVHMIAQHGYGPSPRPRIRYAALRKCLEQLAEHAVKQGASVHVPRIGTGQAGGRWEIIRELLDESLVRRGIHVTVYDLPGRELSERVQELPFMDAPYLEATR